MKIDIDEPRCACGYLLYELESETCPECGRAIPEGDLWSAPGASTGAIPDPDETEART